MIRLEIQHLLRLGPFPSSQHVNPEVIRQQEALVGSIKSPVSDEEAKQLVRLFGPDDYFGIAWTVLHLVESSPSWPIHECLDDTSNEWIARLKESAERSGNM